MKKLFKYLVILLFAFSTVYAGNDIEGNYIDVDGCQDSHGFGMYENGLKIIKLRNQYYAILFDMTCLKNGSPELITDTFSYTGGAVHIEIKPIEIIDKNTKTFKIKNDTFKLKNGNIYQQLPQSYIQKGKKILMEIKSKKQEFSKEQLTRIKKIESQVAPEGYNRYKKISQDYSKIYKDIITYAMYNAIYNKDKKLITALLDNKNSNRCVKVDFAKMTPYEYILKEGYSNIAKIFKNHGVNATCKTLQNSSIKLKPIDKQVLYIVKKTFHYVKDKNITAFKRITDSGRIIRKKQIEKLIKNGEFKWDKEFRYMKYLTHNDIDKIQIYKIAKRDKERKCRIMGTKKVFPCKSLNYCFKIEGKPSFPDNGCTNMYYISGKIFMEPFGW